MKALIIANWKMNLSPTQAVGLALEIKKATKRETEKEVVLFPSFTALESVGKAIENSNLLLGAQNVFWEESGAFTGEESVKNLKELGCQYVIIGHSERRKYLGETNEMINKKISLALENELIPILCIGETLEQRQEGRAEHTLWNQINEGLKGIDLVLSEKLAIAYEPVWAISTSGTGQIMEPGDVQMAFNIIYQNLVDLWPLTIVSNNVRILYGGSVDGAIAAELSKLSKISGFLVGGASLNSEEFTKIIKNS
ncbi:MAG: triose-phosphate isomerase [Candidatus Buchananbacteria bacterium]